VTSKTTGIITYALYINSEPLFFDQIRILMLDLSSKYLYISLSFFYKAFRKQHFGLTFRILFIEIKHLLPLHMKDSNLYGDGPKKFHLSIRFKINNIKIIFRSQIVI
jgi:hypothetical protein